MKEEQTELSIGDEFLGKLERAGEFTGERLKTRKPEIYQACISLVGAGMGELPIAKLLKISVNTVANIKRTEGISIEVEKKNWASKFRSVAGLSAERAIEKLMDDDQAREIPLNQLAVTAGIFTEKAELLTGGATSRIDWVQPSPAVEDFESYMAGLRDQAGVIDVTEPENGTSPGDAETKGQPAEDGLGEPTND